MPCCMESSFADWTIHAAADQGGLPTPTAEAQAAGDWQGSQCWQGLPPCQV